MNAPTRIYAGITRRGADGRITYHYTDLKDALPCDIRDYFEMFLWPHEDIANRDYRTAMMHDLEAQGLRFAWQVGDDEYFTEGTR
jgi:hypothetical protein